MLQKQVQASEFAVVYITSSGFEYLMQESISGSTKLKYHPMIILKNDIYEPDLMTFRTILNYSEIESQA
jgi:hypothetical protein